MSKRPHPPVTPGLGNLRPWRDPVSHEDGVGTLVESLSMSGVEADLAWASMLRTKSRLQQTPTTICCSENRSVRVSRV